MNGNGNASQPKRGKVLETATGGGPRRVRAGCSSGGTGWLRGPENTGSGFDPTLTASCKRFGSARDPACAEGDVFRRLRRYFHRQPGLGLDLGLRSKQFKSQPCSSELGGLSVGMGLKIGVGFHSRW